MAGGRVVNEPTSDESYRPGEPPMVLRTAKVDLTWVGKMIRPLRPVVQESRSVVVAQHVLAAQLVTLCTLEKHSLHTSVAVRDKMELPQGRW